MMMKKILVSYPKLFQSRMFIKQKLSRLLENIEGLSVDCINDYNGFIKDIYSNVSNDLGLDDVRLNRLNKLLNSYDAFVFFWDGIESTELLYQCALKGKRYRVVAVEITRVVNRDKQQEFDVYIGRGTPWGNPYAIGQEGMDREEVISRYRLYFEKEIISDPVRRRELLTLRGKRLGCHCKPLKCHGDVIAEYLNSLEAEPAEIDQVIGSN